MKGHQPFSGRDWLTIQTYLFLYRLQTHLRLGRGDGVLVFPGAAAVGIAENRNGVGGRAATSRSAREVARHRLRTRLRLGSGGEF
jgi:hypothetical protein